MGIESFDARESYPTHYPYAYNIKNALAPIKEKKKRALPLVHLVGGPWFASQSSGVQ